MSNLEIILPAIILFIALMMKLFVDRIPDLPLAIVTAYEFPADMVFLALTFAAAFSISRPDEAGRGLVHFASYVCVAIISVALSRRSTRLFYKEARKTSVAVFLANFSIAISTLIISVNLVSEK
jgi:hypothetical protein